MTAIRETVDLRAEHEASHNIDGECWLCSDQVSWWRAARAQAGYGETPPFMRYNPVRARSHGTNGSYVRGCRCDLCREAARAYKRRYIARTVVFRQQPGVRFQTTMTPEEEQAWLAQF